jgi:hypothetical protein
MKRLAREVEVRKAGAMVLGGCLGCEADLPLGTPVLRVELAVRCPDGSCGRETAVKVLNREVAGVRPPYGCDAWFDLESSNLAAAGRRRLDLIVRFRKGGVYRYAGAGELLAELIRAESVGKFFDRRVRSVGGVRLCAIYGCLGPAAGGGQVLCEDHLSHRR